MRLRFLLSLLLFALSASWVQGQDGSGLGYYVNAEKFRESGQFRAAIDEYNKAIKDDPNNYKFHFQKGLCFAMLNDEDNAVPCFEKAAALKPDYVMSHVALAKLYLRKQRFEDAVNSFDLAFTHESGTAARLDHKLNIIRILQKTGKFDLAEKHIAEAKSVDPNDLNLLYFSAKFHNEIGHHQSAIDDMVKATSLLKTTDPKETAKYYYELGYAYFQIEDYGNANKAFKNADFGPFKTLIAEMTPGFMYSKAVSYLKIFAIDQAKEFADRALHIDPQYSKALDVLVKIAEIKTDKSMVIEHTRNAVKAEQDPVKKAAKLMELAEMELKAGQFAAAEASASESIKLQPRNYLVGFIRAVALEQQGKFTEAAGQLKELIKTPGLDLETKGQYNLLLAIVSRKMNDISGAETALKVALATSFKHAAAWESKQLEALNPIVDTSMK